MSHIAVPLAFGVGLGPRVIPRRLLIAGVIASVVPDLDVIGFKFHVAYGDAFGHRGATHSLTFAVLLGLLAMLFASRLQSGRAMAFLFVCLSAASHGILDTFTNGGLGVALLWPWSTERFFAPWHAIEVSPFGTHVFSSTRGLTVLQSELFWIWLPAVIICAVLYVVRKQIETNHKLTVEKS